MLGPSHKCHFHHDVGFVIRVLSGGRVFTSNPDGLWADAVVIDGDRIVFVGDRTEALAFAGSEADVTHLAGGVALPGFVDATRTCS